MDLRGIFRRGTTQDPQLARIDFAGDGLDDLCPACRAAHAAENAADPARHGAGPRIPGPSAPTVGEQVRRLADLRERGVLSDDDFAVGWAQIMGD